MGWTSWTCWLTMMVGLLFRLFLRRLERLLAWFIARILGGYFGGASVGVALRVGRCSEL